ncbi:hypothetical protein EV182_007953 [Spiromyces aspiralis]|uniref:Uncharacterized protein n=1 Tax=Spiromyces aspiralis TaxID=68401 RepID=A0ACC1H728_9FUNG|nr:hypothetical protein EV182_007953 [Spiromyces aspiralis]
MARKVTPIPYLTIQHDCQIDFAQVLENSDPEATATFWSSAYKQGDESIHDDIKIAKSPSNKDSLVLEGSKGIELTYENKVSEAPMAPR